MVQAITPMKTHSNAMLVDSGKLLILSGHLPYDSALNLVGEDLASQAAYVYASLNETLKLAGVDFEAVVRLTVYAVGLEPSMLPVLRAERDRWICQTQAPAFLMVGVTSLFDPLALIVIDALAVVPD